MGVHAFPNMNPHSISVGHPRAPAPSMLYPALDIDWRFVSYMIVYMIQCHSPKSSHPLPLPLSPKVCSTHLCLFCCLAYRVIIAIFLNSIYMCYGEGQVLQSWKQHKQILLTYTFQMRKICKNISCSKSNILF